MNVCVRNTFVSLWLFFGAMSLSAQGASFYFPTINNAVPGTNRQVALKAVNLDSIVAMQMVIRWNPQVLEFINTNLYHPNFQNSLTGSNFNTARALDSGYVRLQWEGPTSLPPGISIPDSNSIFNFRFKIIGSDTSSSPIYITELLDFPPLNFEVVKVLPDTSNVGYGINDCPRTHGLVRVGFTVSANEAEALEIPFTLAPNPFLVSTQLNFELDETADTQLFITDAMGRIVFEKNFFSLSPGQHGMVIEKEILGAAGHYSLTLRAGRKIATKRFTLF